MKAAAFSFGQLCQALSTIVRQALEGGGPPRDLSRLRWLFAPNLLSFVYALRTAISSLMALGIALG